jgi:hypothetical protein
LVIADDFDEPMLDLWDALSHMNSGAD